MGNCEPAGISIGSVFDILINSDQAFQALYPLVECASHRGAPQFRAREWLTKTVGETVSRGRCVAAGAALPDVANLY